MVAWNGFRTFLARPCPDRSDQTEAISARLLTLWLLIFCFAATALAAFLALPLILFTDIGMGENLQTVLNGSVLSVFLAVVVLGPLVEEVMFRGWLPGTMRALAGTALFLIIWFGGWRLLTNIIPEIEGLGLLVGLSVVALLAFMLVSRKDKTRSAAWYGSLFPLFFWAQGLLFGALHFTNISSTSLLLSMLMTAPLVLCGWIWGYARITLGFGHAWLLHVAYNVPPALAALTLGEA